MPDCPSKPGLVKPHNERLPSKEAINRTLGGVGKLAARSERSAAEACKYNSIIAADHQEVLYLAGMNLIAEKIYRLARDKNSNVETLRIYLELFFKHREQQLKEKKVAVMLRHLELLESKRKLLEEAAKDRGLTDAQFFGKIREVFFPVSNGNGTQTEAQKTKLLGSGFTS
jgi:hypothetical protein